MSRKYTPKVVTANALLEGDVVYLTADDRWTRLHHEAELIEDEAIADLRLLAALKRSSEVVGAYLADARPSAAGPEPIHFREVFRTRGPSNYAHGKQELAGGTLAGQGQLGQGLGGQAVSGQQIGGQEAVSKDAV